MDTFIFLDVGRHFFGNGIMMSKDGAEKFFHALGFLGSHLVRFGNRLNVDFFWFLYFNYENEAFSIIFVKVYLFKHLNHNLL
jgi:hypothetical protein